MVLCKNNSLAELNFKNHTLINIVYITDVQKLEINNFKILMENRHMHNLYAIFVKILDICKLFPYRFGDNPSS